MAHYFQRSLLAIVAAVVASDLVWVCRRHFNIDARAYLLLALLACTCALGGLFYARVRRDPNLSAMLFGTGFLVAFPAAFSLLNYLLLTVAGPRIDWQLAAADRAIGFDWPSVMSVMANHPALNGVFRLGYNLVLPEFAVLILALGFNKRPEQIYRFCFALAAGAAITVAFWTVFPSFGAFSVYELDQATLSRLSLELDQSYARDLLRLLSNGPAWITPGDIKGLVGFPSFHAALALLLTWYIWPIRFLRWPAVFANSLVIVATPIQGGHHAVDVLAGFAVAAISIFATTAFESWVRRSGTGAAAGVLSGSLAAAE